MLLGWKNNCVEHSYVSFGMYCRLPIVLVCNHYTKLGQQNNTKHGTIAI